MYTVHEKLKMTVFVLLESKYFMAGIELCKFTHGLGLYIRGVKSKNIKAQPMCKFAQLYACHELFLNYSFLPVTSKVSCIRRKRGQIICLQGNNKSMVIFVLKRRISCRSVNGHDTSSCDVSELVSC